MEVEPRRKNGPSVGSVMYDDWKNNHLRMAVMNEDVEMISRLVNHGIKGHGAVDLNGFNGLAMRIAIYHNKVESIKIIKHLDKE